MDGTEASVRSAGSHASRASSKAALAAATARAKAQAAHTRAAYSQKEIEMKMEKARIEATLIALEREREAEAATAEAEVMEAAAADLENECRSRRPALPAMQTAEQRTEEYVHRHSQLSGGRLSLNDADSQDEQRARSCSAYVSVCGDGPPTDQPHLLT